MKGMHNLILCIPFLLLKSILLSFRTLYLYRYYQLPHITHGFLYNTE